MVYITDTFGNTYSLFIKQQSIQYNLQQNWFTFQGINMMGVIAMYSDQNVTRQTYDGKQISVPKDINFSNA